MAGAALQGMDVTEFKENFAHGRVYYQNGNEWPRRTILFASANENGRTVFPWRRYDNEPRTPNNPNGRHAEILFLDDIRPFGDRGCILNLELIMSYSPCCNCVDAIKQNAPDTDKIMIQFSNFYKCYEIEFLKKLADLFRAEVSIKIFDEPNDWDMFLNILNVQESQKSEYLRETSNNGRIEREKVDREILKTIVLYARLTKPLYITRMEEECLVHIGRSSDGTEARTYYDIALSISQNELAEAMSKLAF